MARDTSFTLNTLLNDVLDYDTQNEKATNYRSENYNFAPEVAHLYRTARRIGGFRGVYTFRASPDQQVHLPEIAAVCFAEAQDDNEAKEIHQKIWNLGLSPFLVILLPGHVRVYTSRDFDTQNNKPLLESESLDTQLLRELLADFSAFAIDSGAIWKSEVAEKLNSQRKVDTRLLQNLAKLAQILRDEYELESEAAHALIGKYVYIRYLWDRGILTRKWLEQFQINWRKFLGRDATKVELRKLENLLNTKFNGKIFPIPFDNIEDRHVNLVASVFLGDKPLGQGMFQPSLTGLNFEDFKIYDFEYIPTETLSFIYELFLKAQDRSSQTGAFYTPEWLADYVLSEVDTFKSLKRGMKILDPACGSGIFLVLAYQRLIEEELKLRAEANPDKSREVRLKPEELRDILVESIYGVEIEEDACRVTELSLILTLLNYINPPALQENENFRFPNLNGQNIYHADFFDDESPFWTSHDSFDWIVGNPPWKKLGKGDEQTNPKALKWITTNKGTYPVSDNRIEEAFSWRVSEKLAEDGVVGIVHHATSLFNLKAKRYRQAFFTQNEVLRITNFANFRQFLFKGIQIPSDGEKKTSGATAPAATFAYRKFQFDRDKKQIIHYGPFMDNQIQNTGNDLWSITINESEITTVSPLEAEQGDFQTWKFALWGTRRDKEAINRLERRYSLNLAQFCIQKGWLTVEQGPELKTQEEMKRQEADWKQVPQLVGKAYLNTRALNTKRLFSIPKQALSELITQDNNYLRRGNTAIQLSYAPHIYLAATWNHIVYSEEDFVIPPRQIGISAGRHATDEDRIFLKALTAYLRSSLTTYYIFFNVPEWGTFLAAKLVVVKEVREIPVPDFSLEQAQELADVYDRLRAEELESTEGFFTEQNLRARLQKELDSEVARVLELPKKLLQLAQDFVETKLPLDAGVKARQNVTSAPDHASLLEYAQTMRRELDGFVNGTRRHLVSITRGLDFTECIVEIKDVKEVLPPEVKDAEHGDAESFSKLQESLKQQHSQAVYVQRSLRVFDGPKFFMYKPSRLTDWTRTQALNDATDLIGEVLEAEAVA